MTVPLGLERVAITGVTMSVELTVIRLPAVPASDHATMLNVSPAVKRIVAGWVVFRGRG